MSRVASIYQHVRQDLAPDSVLPDAGFASADPALPPGAADSISMKIVLRNEAPDMGPVVDALAELSRRPGQRARQHLEQAMRPRRCIDLIDPLIEAVQTDLRINQTTLYGELQKLLTESHWREAVKLAIALLGLYKQPDDAALLESIGRHEEFTLFATVALGHSLADPVPAWLRLGAHTRGWGKVHAVRRLTRHADRPDVREWLLRYGCANAISDNLLALEIATTCGLHEALATPDPDDALLEGARHILNGLLEPGLAPGMAAYEQGARAALRWVEALAARQPGLPELLTLTGLLHWVEKPGHGWPDDLVRALEARILRVVQAPGVAPLVLADLEHPHPSRAWTARELARRLGLPVFDRLLPVLEANPADMPLLTYLAASAQATQYPALLAATAASPASAQPVLLRGLRRFPTMAAAVPLLLSGLRGDAATRLLTLDVLGRWAVSTVPSELVIAVISTAREDAEGVVRKSARGVLKGWKMSVTY